MIVTEYNLRKWRTFALQLCSKEIPGTGWRSNKCLSVEWPATSTPTPQYYEIRLVTCTSCVWVSH
jgi:hypothetical protein